MGFFGDNWQKKGGQKKGRVELFLVTGREMDEGFVFLCGCEWVLPQRARRDKEGGKDWQKKGG